VTITNPDQPLSVTSGPVLDAEDNQPASAAAAERLWDALYLARIGTSAGALAELEDAVFLFDLPMARTLAHTYAGEGAGTARAEQAAELGLAHAVLAWRQRDSGGFRRFAQSAIVRQLVNDG